ncbi:conserved hypothetical protein [Paraburkholderia piptadeniae]|uniref:Uncharacterized protein n=1 Tax=Paraburkholderia piptadeniae TaxID=1701573 RepID=A0A1N7SVB4_9BURK|nr:hypothetical protein [Paraburkholderia piptadeniae]SIT51350.1 conserved hypothetical protein [Paraburkholderia piptadeniae]
MNKIAYLRNKVAAEFVSHIAQMLTGEIAVEGIWRGFEAKFGSVPDKTLEQLFRRYSWREKSLLETTRNLRPLRRALRQALRFPRKLTADTLRAHLNPIMGWGMGSAESYDEWARDQGERLVTLFMDGITALNSDSPDLSAFERAKMNAGFTKSFSHAADHSIMLDGRVGAALCLLVRQFLRRHPELGVNGVPEVLAFRWGEQRPRPGQPSVPRNPSGEGFKFGRLSSAGSRRWAELNIRANWILRAARDQAGAKWCRGRYGLRHIEAALFMLGYQIDPLATNYANRSFSPSSEAVVPTHSNRRAMPVLTNFARAHAVLSRQDNATVMLRTRRGTPFSASARNRRDGTPVIVFSHNNLVHPSDWGYTCNSYGKAGQRIGQYVAQLDAWVASLTS